MVTALVKQGRGRPRKSANLEGLQIARVAVRVEAHPGRGACSQVERGRGALQPDDPGEVSDEELWKLSRAREISAKWVRHSNDRRMHAGIGYMEPVVYYSGDPWKRKGECVAQLRTAREEAQRD